MFKSFENLANLVAYHRMRKELSNGQLGELLGYKDGQTISRLERGLAGLPLNSMKRTCEVLEIDPEEMLRASLEDHKKTIKIKLGL